MHWMKTCVVITSVLFASAARGGEHEKARAPLPTSYTTREIEGWTVRIDDRLLGGDGAVTGEQAIKLLQAHLLLITTVVSDQPLAKLRAVTIELDLTYGGLTNMQYHPDSDWLKENGYSEKLAKCVHIPMAKYYLSRYEIHRGPWVILHELSHAYHDQVLGFDDARLIAAYKKFRDGGKYKSVLTINGPMREHYALTNEKEFFAEMSECYLGTNDFYPFVAGELKRDEPEIYALLQDIWGKLPEK